MRITCYVCLLLVVAFAAGCEQPRQKPAEKPAEKPALAVMYSGKASSGLFSQQFVLKVWHQHPGTVHNGVMHIKVTYPYASEENTQRTFSFDAWPPNEENARTFKFTHGPFVLASIVQFDFDVQTAETAEEDTFTAIWTGAGWAEGAEKAEIQKQFEVLRQRSQGTSSDTE